MRHSLFLTMLVWASVACGAGVLSSALADDLREIAVAVDSAREESSGTEPDSGRKRRGRDDAAKLIDREIRQLREDVRVLHRDVKRLIDLLENRADEVVTGEKGDLDQDASSNETTKKPIAWPSDLAKAPTITKPASDPEIRTPADVGRNSDSSIPDIAFKEFWELNLSDAVQIALQNSVAVRSLGNVTSFPSGETTTLAISLRSDEISLNEFETSVTNVVSDVESGYWLLWLEYRNLEASREARDTAQALWNSVYEKLKGGVANAQEERQAREQYFFFRRQLEASLYNLYKSEMELRRVLGLVPHDSRLIRPKDEPTPDRVTFDWETAHASALASNIDVARQRSTIREFELQRNTVLDSLPEQLRDQFRKGTVNSRAPAPVPVGLRREVATLRNLEINILREKAQLEDAALNAAHLLSQAIRNTDFTHQSIATSFNRLRASQAELQSLTALHRSGKASLDLLLDAQRRLAQSTFDYNDAQSQYSVAIKEVHVLKGSLLEYRSLKLADNPSASEPVPVDPSPVE